MDLLSLSDKRGYPTISSAKGTRQPDQTPASEEEARKWDFANSKAFQDAVDATGSTGGILKVLAMANLLGQASRMSKTMYTPKTFSKDSSDEKILSKLINRRFPKPPAIMEDDFIDYVRFGSDPANTSKFLWDALSRHVSRLVGELSLVPQKELDRLGSILYKKPSVIDAAASYEPVSNAIHINPSSVVRHVSRKTPAPEQAVRHELTHTRQWNPDTAKNEDLLAYLLHHTSKLVRDTFKTATNPKASWGTLNKDYIKDPIEKSARIVSKRTATLPIPPAVYDRVYKDAVRRSMETSINTLEKVHGSKPLYRYLRNELKSIPD